MTYKDIFFFLPEPGHIIHQNNREVLRNLDLKSKCWGSRWITDGIL